MDAQAESLTVALPNRHAERRWLPATWSGFLIAVLGFLVLYPTAMLLVGALTTTNPVVDGYHFADLSIVKKLTTGVRGLLKGNGSDLVIGNARVTGPKTVEVTSKEGTKETLEATKAIVIATGSSTIEIPSFKLTHGGAVEIMTGAPVPAGADHVVMFEHVHRDAVGALR